MCFITVAPIIMMDVAFCGILVSSSLFLLEGVSCFCPPWNCCFNAWWYFTISGHFHFASSETNLPVCDCIYNWESHWILGFCSSVCRCEQIKGIVAVLMEYRKRFKVERKVTKEMLLLLFRVAIYLVVFFSFLNRGIILINCRFKIGFKVFLYI